MIKSLFFLIQDAASEEKLNQGKGAWKQVHHARKTDATTEDYPVWPDDEVVDSFEGVWPIPMTDDAEDIRILMV
jgi:hypothetical protein